MNPRSAGKTFRSILKWGDPQHEQCLDPKVLAIIQEVFGLEEMDLQGRHLDGGEVVKLDHRCRLSTEQLNDLRGLVGSENVEVSDYSRAYHSFGKYYTDLLNLRLGKVPHPPDAVLYPRGTEEVEQLVQFCHEGGIPLIPFGGHSSVTRGVETPKGGISLDLTRHLNKVLEINEENASVTVQSGIYGPAFEAALNAHGEGYTGGHFPQSFEFSTVGGWVAARGAGQMSTGYGKIEDMVLALKVVTPRGTLETKAYPAAAQGWDLNEIILGSEGVLGVITEVTLKIRPHRPDQTAFASFLFRDFASAILAMREVMQAQIGRPHLFRLSDPEETQLAFSMKGFSDTWTDRYLHFRGYEAGQRTVMFVAVEGHSDYARGVAKRITAVARKYGALKTGAGPVRRWLKQRYSSAYLRDPLMDLGIMTDTLETAVTWEQLLPLWKGVRAYIKSRPQTTCMVHLSHVYENGANLYFTFLSPMEKGRELEDYREFHQGLVDAIVEFGGSLSHHHGVGRVMAPWMESQHGEVGMELMKAIKDHLDPKGIMNPGGMLGLDLNGTQAEDGS